MGLTRPRFEQINSIVTTISDPITVLNKGSTLANIDVGFIFNRDGGTNSNIALFWDESANTFVSAFTTSNGSNDANITISEYANLRLNTLSADTASFSSTGAVKIPSGNTLQRTSGTTGEIRFNTTTSQFEGYQGTSWSSLGGVRSVDNNTYIIAESSPGAGDNILQFFAGGIRQANLSSAGLTVTANVSASYFIGSGQFLTGLPASYSNVNVQAYTESMGFQNFGNVNVAAYVTTNGLTNYSNINLAAYLGGAVTVGGNLTVQGNLTIQGTTTTVNSTTLDVTDLNITVAKGAVNAAAANGAGLTVDGAGATLLYTSSTDSWNINKAFISNSFVNTTSNISTAQLNAGQLNTTGNVLATAGVFNALTVNGLVNSTGNVLAANVNASYFVGSGTALTGINSFGNIFISGQNPVLADNTSDTLTLVAGSGISITTDAANDSITLSTVSTAGAFAADADFGAVSDTPTLTEDEGSVADAVTNSYDLGFISTSGVFTPDQLVLPTYTVTTLPSASTPAQMIYVSDESGGATIAFSDGTNWRRVQDRAIVS